MGLDDYFTEFHGWQEKVLSIGEERRANSQGNHKNPVDDSIGHLRQEYSEVQGSLQRYVLKQSEGNTRALISETGDVVNVAGILLGMMDEQIPLEVMILKLDLKSKKFGTSACTEYVPSHSQEYTPQQLFDFWVREIESIGAQLRERDPTMSEMKRRYDKLSREYVTLVEELDHLSRDDSYHAEVLESLGDFINISAIMMAIAGRMVPFGRLTDKLFEKDEKFGTGKYKGS